MHACHFEEALPEMRWGKPIADRGPEELRWQQMPARVGIDGLLLFTVGSPANEVGSPVNEYAWEPPEPLPYRDFKGIVLF